MNIQNLNQQELEQLQLLLNKMNPPQPIEKIYLDPVNQMIDEIMDEFNFARVADTMKYLSWRWGGEVTIDMLRDEAKRLLRGAAECRLGDFKEEHWELGIICGTGGLKATAYCNEDKTKITGLDLEFVLAEWDAEIED